MIKVYKEFFQWKKYQKMIAVQFILPVNFHSRDYRWNNFKNDQSCYTCTPGFIAWINFAHGHRIAFNQVMVTIFLFGNMINSEINELFW